MKKIFKNETVITIKIEKDDKKKLKQIALNKDTYLSDLLRELILETYIKK
jgi:hypothetical protein